MKIKIKMIKIRIHQIKSPLLAASRSSLRFSTPSGHHLQAGKVGRRIRKAMRPDTAVPPFLDLKAWRDGIPDRRLEDKTMICGLLVSHFGSQTCCWKTFKNARGRP